MSICTWESERSCKLSRHFAGGELTEGQEKELDKKLSFLNDAAVPFAGKNVLEKLIREKDGMLPLLDLLMALEALCHRSCGNMKHVSRAGS